MDFKALHNQKNPLLLCNVWDVPSAKAAKALNYKAIGTSSAAMATMLGYKDGGFMPFEDLLFIVTRIRKSVDLALSVDMEAGYSLEASKIVSHVKMLADLGVVGINVEDSLVDDKRKLRPAQDFAKIIFYVKNQLEKQAIPMFINVRTDTFLLGGEELIEATLARTKIYTEAGADGLFVPGIEKKDDIEAILQEIKLPLNVMAMPKLPAIEELKSMGVHRISMGNFLHHKLNKVFKNEITEVIEGNSLNPLFSNGH